MEHLQDLTKTTRTVSLLVLVTLVENSGCYDFFQAELVLHFYYPQELKDGDWIQIRPYQITTDQCVMIKIYIKGWKCLVGLRSLRSQNSAV